MEIMISAILDKKIVNKHNIKETMKDIEEQFKKFNYNNFDIVDIQDGEKELCGPRLSYKYFDNYHRLETDGPLFIILQFNFSYLYFDTLKSIYYVYLYLENSIIDHKNIQITVKEEGIPTSIYGRKYNTAISKFKIIQSNSQSDTKLDILDFLDYVISNTYNRKEEFEKFVEELKLKSKYKNILENLDNYEKKLIPVSFKIKYELDYKNIHFIVLPNFEDINELISTLEKEKKIKLYILDQKEIPYNLINTDFSGSKIRKYTLLDQNMNLFFVLEEIHALVDDVDCCLYLSTIEIPDKEVIDFILFADKESTIELTNS